MQLSVLHYSCCAAGQAFIILVHLLTAGYRQPLQAHTHASIQARTHTLTLSLYHALNRVRINLCVLMDSSGSFSETLECIFSLIGASSCWLAYFMKKEQFGDLNHNDTRSHPSPPANTQSIFWQSSGLISYMMSNASSQLTPSPLPVEDHLWPKLSCLCRIKDNLAMR